MKVEVKEVHINNVERINRAFKRVNYSLKELTKEMVELKEVSPEIFNSLQEAIHKASKPIK